MRRIITTNFRERNPVPLALIGALLIVALLYVGVNAGNIKFISNRKTYHAEFAESAGLEKQNEVRIAGVTVGQVSKVALDGDKVRVTFKVDAGHKIGADTTAQIKLETLLGTKYLQITPSGSAPLKADIPLAHTSVPFEVYDAFSILAAKSAALNVNEVAKALNTLSDTFGNSNGDAQAAIKGLGAISKTVASRDDQVQQLLSETSSVSAVLSSRDTDLIKLFGDASLVLQTVDQRKVVLEKLLQDTSSLAAQLTSLVKDNRSQLDPLLDQLHDVVNVLGANIGNLDKSVALLGPTSRYLTNAFGTGRWLDVYAENILIPDTILCGVGACQ